MFELANRLVGIYKTNDTTKSVTINPHCFENAVSGQNGTSTMATTTNDETEAMDGVSSSPAPKKLRQSKKGGGAQTEENENIQFSKQINHETESRRAVLGDSTNKISPSI
jgi:hypothetical protein